MADRLSRHGKTTVCALCGNVVPADHLAEHLLSDARLLRVIKTTHPGWDRKDCEDYFRELNGTKGRSREMS